MSEETSGPATRQGSDGASAELRETQFRRMLDAMMERRETRPTARTGLGWTSWVGARPEGKDADDLKLNPPI